MIRKLQFACALLFASGTIANAQLIDGHAYMLGDYVEVGINANGYEGAPCIDGTTHCTGALTKLGFVANPAMDDWLNFNGDFFMPGSPECGFGLTYTLDGVEYTKGNNESGLLNEIEGEIIDYYDTDDSTIVTWEGDVDGIVLTIVYTLRKDEHHYSTDMTVVNTSDDTFTDFYYYHTFDPDNNQSIGWGFGTENTIVSQSGMADDTCIVQAKQEEAWLSEVNLFAYGADWKCYYGGFMNRNGGSMWNGTEGLVTTEGASIFADQAIGIAYKIASFPPGKASAVTFGFGTSFKGIPTAVDDPDTSGEIELDLPKYDIFPNPSNGLISIQTSGVYTFEVIDLKGSVVFTGNGTDNSTIDLQSLEKGTYILNITQDAYTTSEKLMIK
jgi:hypothetical protein